MKDKVAAMMRGEHPLPTVMTSLGLRMLSAGEGSSVYEYTADGRHANPMGTLHGGILCDLADAAMGAAVATTLQDGESFTTLELKINFVRPVWNATLTARARAVSRGRSVALMECDITDEKDRLVARVSATQMILSGEAAKGR